MVAAKPDSHDICFIPSGDTAGFLRERLGAAPGDIVDAQTGEVVGAHEGAFAFTIGQRRGVGLGRPAADGARRYVVDVDISTRRVSVGPAALLDVRTLRAGHARWSGPAPTCPAAGGRAGPGARRGGAALLEPTVRADSTSLLDRPLRGVAPGQSAVLYDGTRVVGSGTITADELGAAGRLAAERAAR